MMKRIQITVTSFLVIAISIMSIILFTNNDVGYGIQRINRNKDETVKNVILVIGDGMGENHIKITSLYYDMQLEINNTETCYYITTQSANKKVTDSAAAGTALASGVKTNNKMVGLTSDGRRVQNLSEYARSINKSVGIVTTALITDATPAAFSAHSTSRKNTDKIIKDQISFSPEVLFGGYNKNFSMNLFRNTSIKVITDKREFSNIGDEKSIFGLFNYDDIANNVANEKSPTLLEMTKMSIEILEKNDNGFFLMVEGAQIDKKSHNNDIVGMIEHTKELDDTIRYIKDYVNNHGDTLLIVTADHETGGLVYDVGMTKVDITDALYTTKSHTEVPVPLFAYGKSKELFYYDMDNTDIHRIIISIFRR